MPVSEIKHRDIEREQQIPLTDTADVCYCRGNAGQSARRDIVGYQEGRIRRRADQASDDNPWWFEDIVLAGT